MSSISNINAGHPHVQPMSAPTPSQEIILDANRIEYTTDKLGRTLGVTRMNARLRRRVVKALSVEQGLKPRYLWDAMLACACVSIDGSPVPFPMTEVAVDGLIDRLEQEGMNAVELCIALNFTPKQVEDIKN